MGGMAHADAASHCQVVGNVLVTTVFGLPSAHTTIGWRRELEVLARAHPRGVGVLTIVDSARTELRRDWQTQEVQKLEVELVSGLPKNIVGAAGIVVGSGPAALMLRAAWTTFNILIRWRFPYGLHRGPGEAALWLAAVLAKAGADCPESAALVEACVAVADIRDAA